MPTLQHDSCLLPAANGCPPVLCGKIAQAGELHPRQRGANTQPRAAQRVIGDGPSAQKPSNTTLAHQGQTDRGVTGCRADRDAALAGGDSGARCIRFDGCRRGGCVACVAVPIGCATHRPAARAIAHRTVPPSRGKGGAKPSAAGKRCGETTRHDVPTRSPVHAAVSQPPVTGSVPLTGGHAGRVRWRCVRGVSWPCAI
jgi:hypothetical protein